MQYFEQNNLSEKTILTELSGGNAELGEAFALALNDMVVQAGITNPKAYPFEITNKSWKSLAQKENKTNDEKDFSFCRGTALRSTGHHHHDFVQQRR